MKLAFKKLKHEKVHFYRSSFLFSFFQAEDGIRDAQESRGLGDVYKRQGVSGVCSNRAQ